LARIALDAMGGDFAPRAPIEGALLALEELDAAHVVQLVGKESIIASELDTLFKGEFKNRSKIRDRLEIIPADDSVDMSEKPTAAVKKPQSSMYVGLQLQAEGKSDGFVSAGNTGAQMVASTVLLKLQANLTRPAIATIFPTASQPVVVLDSGANVDCSKDELLQFAWLGACYAECILGRTNPSIALLSIGEEPSKGNKVVKDAHQLFANAAFSFHGNVEGRDLPRGKSDRGPVDVVVCDGFTGNVVLKFYEAVLPMIGSMLHEAAGIKSSDVYTALRSLDSTEYGGAPLLGVNGVSIIAHGNATPQALKNAVKVAVRSVETNMNDLIGKRLAESAASQPIQS
jgi:glycerol-3-phosphate acyltransferase PlsX